MNKIFFRFLLIILVFNFFETKAQGCEYATETKDSLGVYKSTKDYLVYERIFGKTENYIFLSLINYNGTPLLNLQTIHKSESFIPVVCMDETTRLMFQLQNGKIITLIHNNEENCGTSLKIADANISSRVNSGFFLFLKGTLEDLKTSPITLMRIKYGTESKDYVISKEFTSELTKTTQKAENYFMDYLKCVE